MKNYIKIIAVLTLLVATEGNAFEKISRALSRGADHNVMIQNDANSYEFYVSANNESRKSMHFVGRSEDDKTIAIPMKITKKGKQDEAVLTIVLPSINEDKYIERAKKITLVAPAGKLQDLKQININYSKGYFGKKKGFSLKFTPNNLGIMVK